MNRKLKIKWMVLCLLPCLLAYCTTEDNTDNNSSNDRDDCEYIDTDGDGHFLYREGCTATTDYCDDNSANWSESGCANCADNDLDGFYGNCDSYPNALCDPGPCADTWQNIVGPDCNDDDSDIHFWVTEIYHNGVDDDCDDATPDDSGLSWLKQYEPYTVTFAPKLLTDSTNDVLIGGMIDGEEYIELQDYNGQTVLSGDNDAFLLRYDNNREVDFLETIGGYDTPVTGTGDLYFEYGDAVYDFAEAENGDLFAAGLFDYEATFKAGETGEYSLSASGPINSFVARYGSDGELKWVRKIENALVYSIAVMPDDGLTVLGAMESSFSPIEDTVFDSPGEAAVSISSPATYQFLAQYSSEGNLNWAHPLIIGDCGQNTGIYDMVTTTDGSIIGIGNSYPRLLLTDCTDADPGENDIVVADFESDNPQYVYPLGFIFKLDHNGAPVWSKSISSDERFVEVSSGATVGNDILIAGTGYEPVNKEDVTTAYLTTTYNNVLVITKYSAEGERLWLKTVPVEIGSLNDISVASDGSFAITGDIGHFAYFGQGEINGTPFFIPHRERDFFVAVYNADGNLNWVRTLEWAGESSGLASALADDGTVFILGEAKGELNIELYTIMIYRLAPYPISDPDYYFLARMDVIP